jgi:hypothetical protein
MIIDFFVAYCSILVLRRRDFTRDDDRHSGHIGIEITLDCVAGCEYSCTPIALFIGRG